MKHVTLAGELKEFASADKLLVVHADEGWVDLVSSGSVDFFEKLKLHVARMGVATVTVTLGSQLSEAMLQQSHIHLILGNRPQYRPNVLHVGPSYVWGFWYLDEIGVNADSSLRLRTFRPHGVEWERSEWFFNGVGGYMRDQNVSREAQPPRLDYVERARSVVFCQQIEDRTPREHYVSTDAMIRNAARAAGGGIVYVKPHPFQDQATRERIEAFGASDPNIVVSTASIHDLIAACDWVVTQNSAAGFEALLHKKRVITCGRCDYHHATLVARNEDDLRRYLRGVDPTLEGFEYEKYVAWFLNENCLEPQAADFAERAWARIREKCLL